MRNEDGGERRVELIDLSESGVRLTCDAALAALTRIQVTMMLPGDQVGRDEDAQLATAGVIVWSHRINSGTYDTGVFFSELSHDESELLKAYVASAD